MTIVTNLYGPHAVITGPDRDGRFWVQSGDGAPDMRLDDWDLEWIRRNV